MMNKDYYEILGVARDAGPEEIKHAYRHLALRYHPDTNAGSTETADRFSEISEAYAVLGDPDKRGSYDVFGHAEFGGRPSGSGFETFFRTMQAQGGFGCKGRGMGGGFGRGGCGRRRPFFSGLHGSGAHPSARVVTDLPLTPQEALAGSEKEISITFGSATEQLLVKTPAGLKGGEMLMIKRENMVRIRQDIYLRVTLVDRPFSIHAR
jgi:molecular chaperone DnaJ